jgi:hypothetical protein
MKMSADILSNIQLHGKCVPIGISYKNNVVQVPLVYYNNLVQWNAKSLLSQKEKNPAQAKKEFPVSHYTIYKQNLLMKN